MLPKRQTFEAFFKDPLYLLYKNHLYNYLTRRWLVSRRVRGRGFKKILELGCGISPMLDGSARTIKTDVSWQALTFLKAMSKKGEEARLIACDATQLPFLDDTLECVICSEVIEHIEQDEKVLKEMSRILKRGGELCLTCPIHERYFGFDDEFVGHWRRYEVPDLLLRLSETGFKEFRVYPVLGPLEKQIMEKVTRLFSVIRKGENRHLALGFGVRILAWFFSPIYIFMNYLLAGCVYLQAQLVPTEKVTTLCIQCRKST